MKIDINDEMVDEIVVTELKRYRDSLIGGLEAYKRGVWLHEEDVIDYKKTIKALKQVLSHYEVYES